MENHPLYIRRVFLDPPVHNEDTTFKPGLNVIWAESRETGPANSVGKTSLKELIDFGLGKTNYLPKDKLELLSPLHNRTLVLMFSCHGHPFTLRRDIVPGEICIVLEGWTEESPTDHQPLAYRGNLEGYRSWLEFTVWRGRNRPDEAVKVSLRSIMGLLARDQLNGFTGLEKSFQSESKQSAEDRLMFLLGFITPERVEARRRLSDAATLVKEYESTPQILGKFLAATQEAPEHETRWKLDSLRDQLSRLEGQRHELEGRLRFLHENTISKLTKELANTREQLDRTSGALAVIDVRVKQYRLARSEALSEIEKLDHLKQAKTLLGPLQHERTCPVCGAEITEDHARLLPEHEEPDVTAIEQRQLVLQYEIDDLTVAIESLQINAQQLKTEHKGHETRIHHLQADMAELTKEPTAELVKVNGMLRTIELEVQALQTAGDLYKQRDQMLSQLKAYQSQKREAQRRLKQFEDQEKTRRLDLAHFFDETVSYLYYRHRRGALKGSSLRPEIRLVSEEGVDTGAATQPVATVAFDFALLRYGLSFSESEHPRLLIHDSPAQFEIDHHVYGRIFEWAAHMESEGHPFQYIITTLHVPDWLEAGSPIIRKRLHGGDPTGKLFGFDY